MLGLGELLALAKAYKGTLSTPAGQLAKRGDGEAD